MRNSSALTRPVYFRPLGAALFFSFAALVLIVSEGCGSGDTPKEVAENFLRDVGKKEYNHAKTYCTEEGDRVMDMMKDLDEMMPDSALQEQSYEVLSEKIEGNVATVQFKTSGSSAAPENLTLVKEDGKWQVSMTKESMNTPLLSDQPQETTN